MKKTLVIHPNDPTTDFLKIIYENRGFSEIHCDFEPNKLRALIQDHDRIILLGHGFHHGLLNGYNTIVDKTFVSLLKEKELVGIWCFAKTFFELHGLAGFHTDMFISEKPEAMLMGVNATEQEIEQSNVAFSKAVRNSLFHPECFERIKKSYGKLTSAVVRYNLVRLNFRNPGDPKIQHNHIDYGSLLKEMIENFK